MHAPRPHGRFVDDEQLSADDARAVASLAARLTNFKQVSAIDSLRWRRALPSGRVAMLSDMGGIYKIRVFETEQPDTALSDKRDPLYIPMLFSGVVKKSILRPNEGLEMEVTRLTARRLTQYEGSAATKQKLQRFRVEYNTRHQEFKPIESPFLWTQYTDLRPTWFSGLMASVVQIVGGYGRQDFASLPDDPIERAQMRLPGDVAKKVLEQMGQGLVLPGYKGRPPEDGQIQYDYKFWLHEAVAKGGSQAWLLRIMRRGVYAMPLPIIPATATQAFREYVRDKGDSELTWILDQFGGMPSGETFPSRDSHFEAWVRAGVIIKVCDTADFYDHLSYSSAMGWSFNTSGTMGFNTCYDFDQSGIQEGFCYSMQLRMSEAPNRGWLNQTGMQWETAEDAMTMARYQSMVLKAMKDNPESNRNDDAIVYKMRRAPVGDVLARARIASDSSGKSEVEYWDNYEAAPIASLSGSVRQTRKGRLWAGGRPRNHPQIKFPEPMMDPMGCISHDFSPLEDADVPEPIACDTVMHGYFVGDDLKVVSYFNEPSEFQQEVQSNFDECMQVGSWEEVVTGGDSSVRGHFYTSDIDERRKMALVTTTTKIVGTDLGYDGVPNFAFDHFFSMVGTVWRNRYVKHHTITERTESEGLTLAVCVPFLCRDAVFHAERENITGATRTEFTEWFPVGDPNSYRMFTYDFNFHWVGGITEGNAGHALKVEPYPSKSEPVWVVGYNYSPGPCSDFADNGDWMGGLPVDVTWLVHPNTNEYRHSGGGDPPKWTPTRKTTRGDPEEKALLRVSLVPAIERINDKPSDGYFTQSPSEYGGVFYVDAIKNVAGDAVYASVSEEDLAAPTQRKRWGHTRMADHKSAHHFLGVIHE